MINSLGEFSATIKDVNCLWLLKPWKETWSVEEFTVDTILKTKKKIDRSLLYRDIKQYYGLSKQKAKNILRKNKIIYKVNILVTRKLYRIDNITISILDSLSRKPISNAEISVKELKAELYSSEAIYFKSTDSAIPLPHPNTDTFMQVLCITHPNYHDRVIRLQTDSTKGYPRIDTWKKTVYNTCTLDSGTKVILADVSVLNIHTYNSEIKTLNIPIYLLSSVVMSETLSIARPIIEIKTLELSKNIHCSKKIVYLETNKLQALKVTMAADTAIITTISLANTISELSTKVSDLNGKVFVLLALVGVLITLVITLFGFTYRQSKAIGDAIQIIAISLKETQAIISEREKANKDFSTNYEKHREKIDTQLEKIKETLLTLSKK